MSPGSDTSLYRRLGKRTFDLAVAIPALVVLAPVFALIGLSLSVVQGRPVLFRQRRPGLREKPFTIYKFRTMKDLREEGGARLPDRQRLTGFGAWLRRTSLDELPELWNVVKGEMSLVGPRPLLVDYLDRFSTAQRRRHEVRPGITGWAQVHGRNAITWEEKFDHDLWYVDRVSFGLDLRILLKTVRQVLSGHGIHAPGHATMPEFDGGGE